MANWLSAGIQWLWSHWSLWTHAGCEAGSQPVPPLGGFSPGSGLGRCGPPTVWSYSWGGGGEPPRDERRVHGWLSEHLFLKVKKHWSRRKSVFGLAGCFGEESKWNIIGETYSFTGFTGECQHMAHWGTWNQSHVMHPSATHFLRLCCLPFQTSRTTFFKMQRPKCFSPSVWRSPWGGPTFLRFSRYAWTGAQISCCSWATMTERAVCTQRAGLSPLPLCSQASSRFCSGSKRINMGRDALQITQVQRICYE